MTFTICTADQRSPEWFQSRVGRVTGSRAADILATIKSGEAAVRRDYKAQIVCERLTGLPQENGFFNEAMAWGIDHEADAFAAYESLSGSLVRRTGFLAATDQMVGCSLDGDVDDFTGIVEIKCPKSATHLDYLKLPIDQIPSRHGPQMVHNLWVSGAQWCDFVSYDPRFPEPLQLFCRRLYRDEAQIASYALAVSLFLSEVDRDVAEMQAKMAVTIPVFTRADVFYGIGHSDEA